MYAVIEQGSKQFKVSPGDVIEIELVDIDPEAKNIEIGKVLFINDGKDVRIGEPYIEGAKVTANFVPTAGESVAFGPKLYPTYHRRRKNSAKRIGHKQKYLQVIIDKIEV